MNVLRPLNQVPFMPGMFSPRGGVARRWGCSVGSKFSFIRQKTASLFGASAEAGAVLSNQSKAVQQALNAYGLHLGVAFQITDDILQVGGRFDIRFIARLAGLVALI